MGRVLKVELSEEEEVTLRMWAGAGRGHERMAQRARVILLAAQGWSVKRISGEVALSWQNCLKWRKRFLESGLEGLYDNKRSGAPRLISAEERESLIALAGSAPGTAHSRWSLGRLSEASGHGISTIRRILNPPKPAAWRGLAPEFTEKQAAVLGLYLSRLEHALVIGVYEKAGAETGEAAPLTPPAGPRPLAAGKNWKASLLAALAAHDGAGVAEGEAEGEGGNGGRGFLDFLKRVYRRFPGWELHVMADAPMADAPAGPGEAAPWLAGKRRLKVHYLAPRAAWLNHVEVWLKVFAREAPGGGLWADKEELTERIMARVRAYPDSWAGPFRWTCE